ncbi:zinc ribbon domain-containing protein [Desulfitobacterium sp.]|uniref:zinc ribbon domain-containing protein n=1 Tax=Desulfitobacterium sp. TaxID=49981 RepID=UPI002BBAD6F2|nr:zinc ribbon domain-containing protein [Desulfitobacterium sp.]HVJ49742.1 zinc ribbon domain-containing protein [Desulfitobacterium sp.]
MGSNSRSSSGNHYKRGTHGSGHYQKKGFLGNLLNIMDSRSGAGGNYNNYGNNHNQSAPMQNQPIENRNSINCGKCNSSIPAGSKFCLQCGEKVADALFCTDCGEKVPFDAKFCFKCGTKLNG